MKHKKYRRLVMIFFFFLIIGIIFNYRKYPIVEITMTNENKNEKIVIFYSNNGEKYTDKKVVTTNIRGNKLYQYKISIPEKFDNLRICFGQTAGVTTISQLIVKESFIKQKVISMKDLVDKAVYITDEKESIDFDGELLTLGTNVENASEVYIHLPYHESKYYLYDILKMILFTCIIAITVNLILLYHKNIIKKIKSIAIQLIKKGKLIDKKIGFVFIILLFFSLPILFTYDSSVYLEYTDIFDGKYPWSQWGKTRGWAFPLFLWISKKLFGETSYGIALSYFIAYVIFLLFIYNLFEKYFVKSHKAVCVTAYVLLIVLNPIILGYYHLILTEALAATACAVSAVYTIKIYENILQDGNNREYIIKKFIIISMTSSYLYFLKQMFFIIPILIFAIGDIYLMIVKKQKVIHFLLCIFLSFAMLFGTIKGWNLFLESQESYITVDNEEAETISTNYSGSELMTSYVMKSAINFKLNEKEQCIEVYKDRNIIDSISYTGKMDGIRYLLTCFINHPLLLMGGYIDNYLALTNLYTLKTPKNYVMSDAEIIKEIAFTRGLENTALALYPRYYKLRLNTYDQFGTTERMRQYGVYTDENLVTACLYNKTVRQIYNFVFTVSMLYAPIALIIHTILSLIKRNDIYHMLQIVLAGTVFLYGMALSFMCMRIDRYMFPVLSFSIIVIVADIVSIIKYWGHNFIMHFSKS